MKCENKLQFFLMNLYERLFFPVKALVPLAIVGVSLSASAFFLAKAQRYFNNGKVPIGSSLKPVAT